MRQRQQTIFPGSEQSTGDLTIHSPLSAGLRLFEAHLRRSSMSRYTIVNYRKDLEVLAEFTGYDVPLGDLKHETLRRFLTWMETKRGKPCSRKTYARRVTTLKTFFSWLAESGVIERDPSATIKQRSGEAPVSDALTPKQVKICERVAPLDNRHPLPALFFHIFVNTGIKLGELERLRVSDITRLGDGPFQFAIEARSTRVNRRRRITVDHPNTLPLFQQYVKSVDLGENAFTAKRRAIQDMIERIGLEAGLPFKLTPEVLRWTYALQLRDRNVPPDKIRERLGLTPQHWLEVSRKLEMMLHDYRNTAI